MDLKIQKLPHRFARWIADSTIDPRKLTLTSSTMIVQDEEERYVLLFENEWSISWAKKKNNSLELHDIAKRVEQRKPN